MNRYILLLVWLCFSFGCKNDSSDVLQSSISPGKRDYVWTTDTLFYLNDNQTAMQSMYATSPKNVYVVGHCEVSGGRLWRYDGTRWQTVEIPTLWGYLNAIAGNDSNNIWVVGGRMRSSFIIRFDGSAWREVTGFARRGELRCVTVLSPTTVFAGGENGVLYKYDGTGWQVSDVGQQYFFSSIAAISATEAYATGYVSDVVLPIDSSGSFLFRYNGAGWSKIDSVMWTPNAPAPHMGGTVYARGNTLYTIGNGVYRREGTGWTKLVDGVVGHMYQGGPNSIVAVGQPVLHFNGIDWKEFGEFRWSQVIWFDCFTDGNEVFIVGNDNWRSFILHGK